MTNRIVDLREIAVSTVGEVAAEMCASGLDIKAARDAMKEGAYDAADAVCTYYWQQEQVIAEHEQEFGGEAEELVRETSYTADQWREARAAWALCVALVALRHYTEKAIGDLEEAADALLDIAREASGDDDLTLDDLAVTLRCPHGWAAHDREDEAGVHYWTSRQLDGMNAVAVDAGGCWLAYTWAPDEA